MLGVGLEQGNEISAGHQGHSLSCLPTLNDAGGLEALLATVRRLEPDLAQVYMAIEGVGQDLILAVRGRVPGHPIHLPGWWIVTVTASP